MAIAGENGQIRSNIVKKETLCGDVPMYMLLQKQYHTQTSFANQARVAFLVNIKPSTSELAKLGGYGESIPNNIKDVGKCKVFL